MPIFKFDPRKARTNWTKHGVSFDAAVSVFERDPSAYTDLDELHSENDLRFFTIGAVRQIKRMVVGILIVRALVRNRLSRPGSSCPSFMFSTKDEAAREVRPFPSVNG